MKRKCGNVKNQCIAYFDCAMRKSKIRNETRIINGRQAIIYLFIYLFCDISTLICGSESRAN